MADILRSGVEYLRDTLQGYVSSSITYTRSGTGSVTIDATVSVNTAAATDAQGNLRTEWRDRDYIVVAADMVIGSTAITPRRGDRITDGSDTYEVQSQGSEPVYRPADAYGLMWRIHTRKV